MATLLAEETKVEIHCHSKASLRSFLATSGIRWYEILTVGQCSLIAKINPQTPNWSENHNVYKVTEK